MRRRALVGSIMAALLTACAATQPRATTTPTAVVAVVNEPTATPALVSPAPSDVASAAAIPSEPATDTPIASPTAAASNAPAPLGDENGPVTAAMAQVGVGGERYATLGDPNAPLTIVEYSDYGCPFCRRHASSTFPTIKAQYIDTGKAYYVYKDFPIVRTHPQAPFAAQAAECAGEQGQYWLMHDRLFAAPEEWDTTIEAARASFDQYAGELDLDAASFGQCLDANRYQNEVQADYDEAVGLGMTGTPSFVINGKLLVGAQPTEDWIQILDRELAGQ